MSLGISAKVPRDLEVSCTSKEFILWLESFENYLCVVEIDSPLTSVQKHALLKNCIGEDGLGIISGLTYDKTKDPYTDLVAALTTYFVPKTNLTYERFRFRSLRQTDGIQSFVNELHSIGKNCDFENSKIDTVYNQNVRDQFLIGLRSDNLRKCLLSETDLTLAKAIAKALAYESSAEKVEEMKTEAKTSEVELMTLKTPRNREFSKRAQRSNPRKGPECYFCHQRGHIQAHCFKKQEADAKIPVCDFCHKKEHVRDKCYRFLKSNSPDTHVNFMFGLEPQLRSGRASELKFAKGTFYDCELEGLVDSGASISVISRQFVAENALSKAVKPTSHSAIAAGQTTVEFKQSIKGPLVVGNKLIEAEFYVAPWLKQDCILGMDVLGGSVPSN